MRKHTNIIVIVIFFIFALFSLGFGEESITITTYYPSPYGVYKTLRLNPSPRAATCQPGDMTYHDGSGSILAGYYFCDNSAAWQSAGGGGGFWSRDATYATLSPTTSSDKVGIGGSWSLARLSAFTSDGANTGVWGGNWFTIGTGNGVYGQATGSATGVRGESGSGMGGYFSSSGGYALITGAGNVGIGMANPMIKFQTAISTNVNLGFGAGNYGGAARLLSSTDLGSLIPLEILGSTIDLDVGPGRTGLFVSSTGNVVIGPGRSPSHHFQVNDVGTAIERFGVQSGSNNLYAYGALQSSWSDARLKKNVQPQQDMLKRIMKVNPVTYNWKEEAKLDNKMHYGVIAQELINIFPALVYEDRDGHLNVQRDEMQFILIQAIKEQQQEIESLKSEIQKLKAKLGQIKARK